MSARDNVRILLVDDRETVRRGLRMRLDVEPALEVVGEADCGPDAVALVVVTEPDVVLMDVRMPGGDGIAAVAAIRTAAPGVRVVMLSLYDDPASRAAAEAAGAVAFVGKHDPERALLDTIRRVVAR